MRVDRWLRSVCLVLVCVGCGPAPKGQTVTVEKTDYNPPPAPTQLVDDQLEDRPALPLDATLISPAQVDPHREWQLNTSAAVFRLNVPLIIPEYHQSLLKLHPSYAQARKATDGDYFLVSANMVDGKAKQVDDGLYAAVELLQFEGSPPQIASSVQLVRRVFDKLPPNSEAADFLAAALDLAGQPPPDSSPRAAELRARFLADELRSKPIGVYTWSKTLKQVWHFNRFLQQGFARDRAIPQAIRNALHADADLLREYDRVNGFFARLTNPFASLPVRDLAAQPLDDAAFERLCHERGARLGETAFFPPATSREGELFDRLFPLGVPREANLMQQLTSRVRSGKVSLAPRADSGWYDHQVFALEPLLLMEKAAEHRKLLLMRSYKERMLMAFQALVTKRRETHVRNFMEEKKDEAGGPGPPSLQEPIRPQFRVEPCPSFYLRTARAYRFVTGHLTASLGAETLQSVHGLTENGPRARTLSADLLGMQRLCLGLYLVSCEDLGMRPDLAPEEAADVDECRRTALDWLASIHTDSDLACDTRVSVPIFANPGRTRIWATLGVRMTRLEVTFARPPSIRPAVGDHPWTVAEELGERAYMIPVDEFAEFELPRAGVLNRDEFRAICDREGTRERILEALEAPR